MLHSMGRKSTKKDKYTFDSFYAIVIDDKDRGIQNSRQ